MIVNGKNKDIKSGITVEHLLKEFDLSLDKVVVEVNFKIILKENYKETLLNEEDRIEIISFVGGG